MLERMRGARTKANLYKFLDLLPVAIPTALAAFGAVAVFFLLRNEYKSSYVWTFGLIAALLSFVIIWRRYKVDSPGSDHEKRVAIVILLIGVLVWAGFNARYSSQHLITNRDPGTYTVASGWLVNHDSIEITATTPFGVAPGVQPNSGGFSKDTLHQGKLYAQGTHILPALLGLIGRIVGDGRMLHFNVIFGGTALLALYGFVRLLVRPRWALLATTAVALSLPLIHFSRDTFTEPLAMTFTFSMLALLWGAQKTGKISLWMLAGLAAGAGVLTRIDAWIELAALVVFLAVYLGLAKSKERAVKSAQVLAFFAGAAIPTAIGYMDVKYLAHGYYKDQWHHIRPEIILVFGLVIIGMAAVGLAWRTTLVAWINQRTKWRAKTIFWATIIVAVVLAARPLLYQAHVTKKAISPTGAVTYHTVRTYAELTVNWLLWYLGPVLTVLGFYGLAEAGRKAMKDRDMLLLPAFLVITCVSLLYLVKPSIYADQIWAARRQLPVIMPGIAAFGALGLERLYSKGLIKRLKVDGRSLALVLTGVAIMSPLVISWPFIPLREGAFRAAIFDTCKVLPKNAAVLWVGEARTELVEPTVTFCNIPAEGYGKNFRRNQPPQNVLALAAKNARAAGYVPLIGAFGSDASILGGVQNATVVEDFNYEWIEQPYDRPPVGFVHRENTIMLGELQTDGSIKPFVEAQPANR